MVTERTVQKVKSSDDYIFWKTPVQHVVYYAIYMPCP